jgi:hypothetical protein
MRAVAHNPKFARRSGSRKASAASQRADKRRESIGKPFHCTVPQTVNEEKAMSDTSVTTTPPSPAPAATPAPAHEVPINPNPVNSPNPVGSQAPEKPTSGSDGRREAIQRAFDRASGTTPKAAAAAAAAG